jgi:hypothetical protein
MNPNLARANTYGYASVDYPGAAQSQVLDSNGTTTVGEYHGFLFAGGAYSTIDVAGASGTMLARINNGGEVVGVFIDALTGQHGLIGS